jgi:hypothetical protein
MNSSAASEGKGYEGCEDISALIFNNEDHEFTCCDVVTSRRRDRNVTHQRAITDSKKDINQSMADQTSLTKQKQDHGPS